MRHGRTIDPPREAPLRAWPWLALLMLVHVLAYPWSTVIVDSARDLYWATQIADGGEWPLRGPVIYYLGNLSPLWYFVLAPVVAATHSQTAVAVFIGLLAALKFPLAFVLGRELGGRRLGLVFAALLALPSWSIVQLMVATHTNLVETLVLLFGLCLTRWVKFDDGRWLAASGLVFGLALNAHPTTALLALPAAALWLTQARARRPMWASLALGTLLALLPFVPVLIAEWREGWPLITKLGTYAGERTGTLSLERYLGTLDGAVLGGIRMVAEHWVGSAARWPLWIGFGAVTALGLLGLPFAVHDARRRVLVLVLLPLVLAIPAMLAASRPGVVAYMLFHWQALFALLLAFGVARWLHGRNGARRAHGIAALALLLSASTSLALIGRAEQGLIRMPITELGLLERHDLPVEGVALLPVYRADRLGAALCGADKPQVFHADLALLVESMLIRSARWRCAAPPVRVIGGADEREADHWIGLPPRVMQELGIDATARLGGWPLARAQRVVAPAASQAIPEGTLYPPRTVASAEREVSLRFTTAGGARLIVANPITHVAVLRELRAEADGKPITGTALTNVSTLLSCQTCGDRDTEWLIRYRSNAPELTEVLVLDRDGPSAQHGATEVRVSDVPAM
jgi:hypothetical protein